MIYAKTSDKMVHCHVPLRWKKRKGLKEGKKWLRGGGRVDGKNIKGKGKDKEENEGRRKKPHERR